MSNKQVKLRTSLMRCPYHYTKARSQRILTFKLFLGNQKRFLNDPKEFSYT